MKPEDKTKGLLKELFEDLPRVNWGKVIAQGRLGRVLWLFAKTIYSGSLYLFVVVIPRIVSDAWKRRKP